MKKRQRVRHVVAMCAVLLVVCLLGTSALVWLYRYPYSLASRPAAVLHEAGEFGYLSDDTGALSLPTLRAQQAFVYDCEKQAILYRKGANKVVYPASTTKLLTILCALEHIAPETVVTPGEELSLVDASSSRAYITSAHRLTVEMLIEGMLLPSGNDAAYVLAAAVGEKLSQGRAKGAEAVAVFMQEMRAYAGRIGLVGTEFTTPDGLAQREHYSTVEDMVLISRLAMQNDIIRRYASMAEDDVVYASGHTNHWKNSNLLVRPDSAYYDARVTGLKTGSLEHNFCLIFTAEADGHSYIVGLFGEWEKMDRYEDARAILEVLFNE